MKTKMTLILLLLLTGIATSCGKSSSSSGGTAGSSQALSPNAIELGQISNEETITAIKIKKSSDGIEWKSEYTRTLGVALSDDSFSSLYDTQINSDDLRLVRCENFNELTLAQKQVFYVVYLAAIAEAESDFITDMETYNPSDRTMNVGMLQIDHAVANTHTKGRLGSLDNGDLKDASINLQVGVFILRNQIAGKAARTRLFPPNSYYWEVVSRNKTRVLKNIEANRSNINFCR